MKKMCFILVLLGLFLSLPVYSQDSNIVHAPNKVWVDSNADMQIRKLIAPNHPQISIVYVRVSGFSKHISSYTIKEIDSGLFYCKNDLGYTHLLKLNGKEPLLQKLPEGQNYYMYKKQTGTDTMDEIIVNVDNNSATLYSLDGTMLNLLSTGKSKFFVNKELFLDIQNNLTKGEFQKRKQIPK